MTDRERRAEGLGCVVSLLFLVALILWLTDVARADSCRRAVTVEIPVITVYADGRVEQTFVPATTWIEIPCGAPPSTARLDLEVE